jgi:glycosyltransferase involved in cell wall biosynthesis
MPPLRVLHVFPGFAVGGAQVRTVRLVSGLGDDFEHAVLSLDGNRAGYALLDDPARLAWIEPPPRAGSLATTRALARILRRERPDVVATYNWGAIDALLAARAVGRRALLHHEDGFGPEEAERRLLRRSLWRRMVLPLAHRVVVPSQVLAGIAEHEWRVPRSRLALVPNGVDLARFAPGAEREAGARLRCELCIPAGAFVVASVGGLRPEKRPDRLLEAAARLPGVHLVVVGDGPLRPALAERAAADDLRGRVHLRGARKDPRPELAAADAFALPSDTEQMPIAMVEAMAMGLCVVATDVGDVRPILPVEQHALVVPVGGGDAGARGLAAALAELAADPLRRARLGALNAAAAAANFGFERMAERYRDLVRGAAARDGAR